METTPSHEGWTWEAFKAREEAKELAERTRLKPLFDKAIDALKMKRIGIGNNDLHENERYTLFVAMFPRPHILLCTRSNTSSLFGFDTEEGLADMLNFVKKRK